MENFAEKFKAARKAAGLTQEEMLAAMDIPRRTVQDWEKGIMTPPPYVQRLVLEKLEGLNPDNMGEWTGVWDEECSKCGKVSEYRTPFCPKCGVRMKNGGTE